MDWVKSLVNKCKSYLSKDTTVEQVDIRVESVPEWLFKITVRFPEELKTKAIETKTEIDDLFTSIDINLDKMKLRQILNQSLSKYKKESIETNKDNYILKVKSIIQQNKKDIQGIESYRKFFHKIVSKIDESEESLTNTGRKISEFYSDLLGKIEKDFQAVKKSVSSFETHFEGSNDQKVKQILHKLKSIDELTIKYEEVKKELDEKDAEIDKLKNQVYKLGEKESEIKNSARFSDVMKKETKLQSSLEKLEHLFSNLTQKLDSVKLPLKKYAEKINEKSLIKEYYLHLEYALEHDTDLRIVEILKDLEKECGKEDSSFVNELNFSIDDVESLLSSIKSLTSHFKEFVSEIEDAKKQVLLARRSARKQVILSELEDVESRIKFYQDKIIKSSLERSVIVKELQKINVPEHKEKLQKDLYLLTGYNVNIIYEDKS